MSIANSSEYLGSGMGGAGYGFGGGGGFGGIAPFGLFGLAGIGGLGDRGRERCDNNDGGGNTIFGAAILSKLGSIEGSIPLAALGTQNAILEQTIGITSTLNENNISQLQAASAIKDSVMNNASVALLNANQNTQSILGAICGLGSKMDQNRISELETELLEQRSARRAAATEINVTQSVNQNQQQAQLQVQLASLATAFHGLVGDIQNIKQNQSNINFGTQAGVGQGQSATANKVGG